jgi:2,3-bisphosphoglycerate-dependent phosphoglycerate mutase
MKSTRIILIRHGETVWNLEGRCQGHLDSALTNTGMEQAKALSERLVKEQFSALYSSDLGRAYSTAKFIAEGLSHTIITDKRLRERNLGVFEGLNKQEILELYPDDYQSYKSYKPDYVLPKGESAQQRFCRVIDCLEEFAQKHIGEAIVVVGHGGVLDSLFRHTVGIPLNTPRNFQLLNASINIFYYEHKRWILQTWGDISHLKTTRALDDF